MRWEEKSELIETNKVTRDTNHTQYTFEWRRELMKVKEKTKKRKYLVKK